MFRRSRRNWGMQQHDNLARGPMKTTSLQSALLFAIALLSSTPRDVGAADEVAGKLITFNDNGAWCWYQDPRIVHDPANGTLLIASVAAPEGADGAARSGDGDVGTYHRPSGPTGPFVLPHAR